MGNYGNHNRNLQIHYGGFTADEWETYRDNQLHGKSDYVAPGKTVRPEHYKMPPRDYSVDEKIASLLDLLNNPLGNKTDIHYRLGCAYRAKGELTQAREHFGIAARKGHSESQKELDALSHT